MKPLLFFLTLLGMTFPEIFAVILFPPFLWLIFLCLFCYFIFILTKFEPEQEPPSPPSL